MSYSFQNVKPRMIYTFFASRDEISIMPFIKIYPIYYQAVHFFNLFWGFLTTSHYKCSSGLTSNSDIEHFYLLNKKRVSTMLSWTSWRLSPCSWFKLSSKIYLLAVPRRYFFCVFFFCRVFVMLSSVCLLMPCSHLLGKG